jgi:hypothetical protein
VIPNQNRAKIVPTLPAFICVWYFADVTLVVLYALNALVRDGKRDKLTWLLDLNQEGNIPTWFSTVQYGLIGALLLIFAIRNLDRTRKSSVLLVFLPLVFILLSLDETAQIHEYIGAKSDALLPGAARTNTIFRITGIWMFLVGIPFFVAMIALLLSIRPYFSQSRGVLIKFFIGLCILMLGAAGIETISNFVGRRTLDYYTQVAAEELAEMLGSTTMLWAAYELLIAHGFRINLQPAISVSEGQTGHRPD